MGAVPVQGERSGAGTSWRSYALRTTKDVEAWVQGVTLREVTQGRKLLKALGWLVQG